MGQGKERPDPERGGGKGAHTRPSVLLVWPLTAEANQWLDANVDHQLTIDEGISFDHRHVDAILAGLKEAGFEVIMRSLASGGVGTLVYRMG